MSSVVRSPNPEAEPMRYPSLASLRADHTALLKRYREQGNEPQILAEIEQVMRRGRETGAVLGSEDDRWTAQGLLDYWSSLLYRAGQVEPPDATLAEFDSSLAPDLDDALCPYLGLEAFRAEKQHLFFGRQRLLNKLLKHVANHRLLMVVGASGSGKSSVVLGGLLPKLVAGALPGSERWVYYAPIVPGADPLAALARRLKPVQMTMVDWVPGQVAAFQRDPFHLLQLVTPAAGEQIAGKQAERQPVVLFIDQFEEVFTLCRDDAVRAALVQNLVNFVQVADRPNRLILTMRSDFESQLVRLPELLELFEDAHIRTTALEASELREAISQPAALVGLKFEEGLIDELLSDVLGEPAALPLLQFTLLKLWDHRERNRLTWEAYRRLGGGRLALARSADAFHDGLILEEQVTMKRILLRMVRPGEGLEVTSNRIPLSDLYRSGEAEDRVERVVGKLTQARLVRFTEGDTLEDAQVEIAHEALVRNWPRLVEWLDEERVSIRQRLRLTTAAEQWQNKDQDSSALLRGELLREALTYDDLNYLETEFVERSIKAKRNRCLSWFGAITGILVTIGGLAVIAVSGVLQTGAARAQVENATQQAADAKREAIAAEKELLNAANEQLAAEERLRAAQARVIRVEAQLKQEESQFAELSTRREDVEIKIARVENQQQAAEQALASANQAQQDAKARVIESQTQQRQAEQDLALAQQARQVAEEERNKAEIAIAALERQLVQIRDQRQEVELLQRAEEVYGFLPTSPEDGVILGIQLVGESQSKLNRVPEAIQTSLNEAIEAVLLGTTDQNNFRTAVAFSPDKKLGAVIDADGQVSILDARGREVAKFSGGFEKIRQVIFSLDGEEIAIIDAGDVVHLWGVNGQEIGRFDSAGKPIRTAIFSPDGQQIAIINKEGGANLWTSSGELQATFQGVRSLVFSPNSALIATRALDNTVKLQDLQGNPPTSLAGQNSLVSTMAFGPDADLIATADVNGRIFLWETQSGILISQIETSGQSILSLRFSSDGQQIETRDRNGTAYLWTLQGELIREIPQQENWRSLLELACQTDQIKSLLTESITQTASAAKKVCEDYVVTPKIRTEPRESKLKSNRGEEHGQQAKKLQQRIQGQSRAGGGQRSAQRERSESRP